MTLWVLLNGYLFKFKMVKKVILYLEYKKKNSQIITKLKNLSKNYRCIIPISLIGKEEHTRNHKIQKIPWPGKVDSIV